MEFNAGDDAVAPVIAIVLMVAITVIVATIVSTFALTLAESERQQPVTGAVSMEVDSTNEEVNIHVTSMGNAEFIVLRGVHDSFQDHEPHLNESGASLTLEYNSTDPSEGHLYERGTISAVGVQGTVAEYETHNDVQTVAIVPVESQTTLNQVDYDFS